MRCAVRLYRAKSISSHRNVCLELYLILLRAAIRKNLQALLPNPSLFVACYASKNTTLSTLSHKPQPLTHSLADRKVLSLYGLCMGHNWEKTSKLQGCKGKLFPTIILISYHPQGIYYNTK